MKICLIGNDYVQQFPTISYGGIEICVESLAEGLYRANKDFFVLAPKRTVRKDYPFEVIETDFEAGGLSDNFAISCRKYIKELNPDVIWSQSDWSANNLYDLGKPIICTVHDSSYKTKNMVRFYPNVKYRFLSNFSKKIWVTEKWEEEKSFICHSGVTEDNYKGFLKDRENYHLWVGGLRWGKYAKGLDVVMALAARYKDENFHVYGTGDKRLEEELIEYSKSHKNFKYKGPLSRGECHYSAFSRAKSFIIPTRIPDCFPRVVLEALTCGTPVVTLNEKSSVLETINKDSGFVINDIEDFKKVLDKKWNYDTIYNYSKKFHIENEVKYLYNVSCTGF